MAEPHLTGHCGCGAVQFEISEPLVHAVYCHCTRCQRRTGAGAAASALLAPGSLTITAGADLVRRWKPENGFEKAFCSECGSALFSFNPKNADTAVVRLGAIDGDPGVRPSFHQFTDFAAVWEPIPDDGLPRYPLARPR